MIVSPNGSELLIARVEDQTVRLDAKTGVIHIQANSVAQGLRLSPLANDFDNYLKAIRYR